MTLRFISAVFTYVGNEQHDFENIADPIGVRLRSHTITMLVCHGKWA